LSRLCSVISKFNHLRALVAEKAFSKVDIYEQRTSAGGLWNHTASSLDDGVFSVPSTDPYGRVEKQVNGEFVTPIYDSLEVNIPWPMMAFSNQPFEDGVPLFPGHDEVLKYLRTYAQDVKHLIRFGMQVRKIKLLEELKTAEDGGSKTAKWRIQAWDLQKEKEVTEEYEAVIMASGHFAVPSIPEIDGLREWKTMYPDSVSHSKYYRKPADQAGKTVLVIGSSASGLDISDHLTTTAKLPVYLSQKSESELAGGFPPNPDVRIVKRVDKFDVATKRAYLVDGEIINDIDSIIFCTGYLYTFPLFEGLKPLLLVDGKMVHATYKHLFCAVHPSLSFLTLPQKIIPFPIAEAQSSVLARIYSGRLSISLAEEDMFKWEEKRWVKVKCHEERFHSLESLEDAAYINWLIKWAGTAVKKDGLDNGGDGLLPKEWDSKKAWIRKRIPKMRKAFMSHREERFNVKTYGELGDEFEVIGEEEIPDFED
jgi:hypothetical protein